jgi:hypothetical protein
MLSRNSANNEHVFNQHKWLQLWPLPNTGTTLPMPYEELE